MNGGYTRDRIFEFPGAKCAQMENDFDAPKIVTFGRWYRFSSGCRVIALYAEWAASQQPVLSLAICQYMCSHTHAHLYRLLFSLSRSRERGKAKRRKREKKRTEARMRAEKGVGERVRGLGIASCIEEHKRSRNNTIGRRASEHRLTRARTFRARIRVLSPAGERCIYGG